MNHLVMPLHKKLEQQKYFGTLTLKYADGKVVHVNSEQALKEKEIEELISR